MSTQSDEPPSKSNEKIKSDEEAEIISESTKKSNLSVGTEWFVLSSSWWNKWKEYSGFREFSDEKVEEENENSKKEEKADEKEKEKSRPGTIDNSDILSRENKPNSKFVRLKPGLNIDQDYVLVDPTSWDHLKSWYGKDIKNGEAVQKGIEIRRKVIEEGEKKYLRVEVYPLFFCLSKVKENGVEDPDTQIEILISKNATVKELKEKALEEWDMKATEVNHLRFWDAFNAKVLTFENSETLENLDEIPKILVEFSNSDGIFGRDDKKKSNGKKGSEKNLEKNSSNSNIPLNNIKKKVTNWFSRKPSPPSESSKKSQNSERSEKERPENSQKSQSSKGVGGLSGLVNLTNTCFMNSALQCLSNTEDLTNYFLSGKFKSELNRNNPLGAKGLIAEEYGSLIKLNWMGNGSSISPKGLKSTIAKFAPQFIDFNQHDAQEFLAYLLDGLHEDLNRIHEKPYTETKEYNGIPEEEAAELAWQLHLKRNKSVIVDLFQGQLKSTLVCPICHHISKTWDPFMYLSLPLPVDSERKIEMTLVRYENNWTSPVRFLVKVDKNGKISDLGAKLTNLVSGMNGKDLLMADVRQKSLIWSYLTGRDPVYNLRTEGQVFAYELPQNASESIRLQVVHRKPAGFQIGKKPEENEKANGKDNGKEGSLNAKKKFDIFGLPFLIYFQENKTTGEQFYIETFERVKNLLDFEWKVKEEESEEPKYPFRITIVSAHCTSCGLCDKECTGCPILPDQNTLPLHQSGHTISIEWSAEALSQCSSLSGFGKVEEDSSLKSEVAAKEVTLYTALNLFTTDEKLGASDPWYCPKCKEFQQANKKFDLWKMPSTLVIHLKRFRTMREKNVVFVDFPLEELDLTPYVKTTQEIPPIYDCFAISNHMGSLQGGHYTAFAKSKTDNNWYCFNDEKVTSVQTESLKSPSAYVLFYKRREPPPQ